jgi:hypothetical protein
MSQVGHIVAAQYERAIGHVHSSLRIFGPSPYACISSVNSKICKHRRLDHEWPADDSVQSECRFFEEMVSRAGLQPNRINMNIDAYSRSSIDKNGVGN